MKTEDRVFQLAAQRKEWVVSFIGPIFLCWEKGQEFFVLVRRTGDVVRPKDFAKLEKLDETHPTYVCADGDPERLIPFRDFPHTFSDVGRNPTSGALSHNTIHNYKHKLNKLIKEYELVVDLAEYPEAEKEILRAKIESVRAKINITNLEKERDEKEQAEQERREKEIKEKAAKEMAEKARVLKDQEEEAKWQRLEQLAKEQENK